jgi:UDPglucose 6-dehydrogenase
MKLLIVGTGYVGLVSGACLAEMGHEVICLDTDATKIEALQNGSIPIYEPGLEEMVRRNTKAQRLTFTTDYPSAVAAATVCFLTVDTPIGKKGQADLTSLRHAVTSIATHMDGYKIIVNKSTVPIGTAEVVSEQIAGILAARNVAIEFTVVSNPEFLKEGNAINDFMKPDRIIIGSSNEKAIATMKQIYAPFMLNHDRLLVMDIPSAEMSKYAANAMLALRISFMNELSGLCEIYNADINKVRLGIGSDKRIGHNFLYPGPGFGGSCFPKDIRALAQQAAEKEYETDLLNAISHVNARQKKVIANKILRYFSEKQGVAHATIAILGLSFKPDTDDVRESASISLINQLLEVDAKLRLYDPVAMDNGKKVIPQHPHITWCDSVLHAAEGADAIALMTEWKQFRFLDFAALRQKMRGYALFDGRNQFNPADVLKEGFDYISIGRRSASVQQMEASSDVADNEELINSCG